MISNVSANQTSSLNLSGAFGVLGGIIQGFGGLGDVASALLGYSSLVDPFRVAFDTFGRRLAILGFAVDALGSAYNRFSQGFNGKQFGLFVADTFYYGAKAYGMYKAGQLIASAAGYAGLSVAFGLAAFTPVGWAIAGGILAAAAVVAVGIIIVNAVGNFFDNLWKSIFG